MVNTIKQLYSFEQFQVDVANRLLTRQGETVPLAPKVFELLLLLIERQGDVIEKEELMRLLWPDTVVEYNNLTVSMSALRKALGDGKEGIKFIETIPRRGYRFVAQVEEEQPTTVSSPAVASFTALELEEPVAESEIMEPEIVLLNSGAPQSLQTVRRRKFISAFWAVGALLLIATTTAWLWRDKQATFNRAEIRSLAVLPFKSLATGLGDESLGLGLADALITRLSNTGRIVVRPTSAIIKYSKPDLDLKTAARELEVDALLDGRVQRDGDRLRITIQFLRASDGETIWGQTFDERFTNILTVQNTISEKVAKALTLKLTESDRQRLSKKYTDNPDAFEAYLKGRYYWNKRSPESIARAIENFKRAIEFDPAYALAYAGLADSYVSLATPQVVLTGRKGQNYWEQAKSSALKALEIDESLAEAHASLGSVYASDDDAAGHREFDRAIELNPNYASVYSFYAICLIGDGRLEDALAKIKKARELDPLSVAINTNFGMVLCRLRKPDEAIAQLRKAEELDPNFMRMRWGLGLAYEQKGQFNEAIQELQKAVKLSNDGLVALASLGHAYAMVGRRNEANQVLAQILGKIEKGEKNAYYLAAIYAGLGDKEKALSVLESNRGNYAHKMLGFDHFFDSLRTDPRFEALARD